MVALVSGCANLLPVPDSCRVLRAGGPGQGARSARRGGAAKLRIGVGCRWGIGGRRVERVGCEAGAGDEAEFGPFAELGVQVAGGDLEAFGEFAAAPVAVGFGGHQGGDALSAGVRAGRPWPAGCAAVAMGPAGLEVEGRGVDGDVDRGDGGGGGGAAVVPVEVAG